MNRNKSMPNRLVASSTTMNSSRFSNAGANIISKYYLPSAGVNRLGLPG